MELFSIMPWTDSLKGHEREWLEANGFHNTYKDGYPPVDGMYEWVDINTMKIYLFKAGPNGVFVTDANIVIPRNIVAYIARRLLMRYVSMSVH